MPSQTHSDTAGGRGRVEGIGQQPSRVREEIDAVIRSKRSAGTTRKGEARHSAGGGSTTWVENEAWVFVA